MGREYGLTDEQVELEVERLKKSPYVKLAIEEQKLKTRKRKYFYQLRWYEKHGKELAEKGVTIESLKEQFEELESAGGSDESENL